MLIKPAMKIKRKTIDFKEFSNNISEILSSSLSIAKEDTDIDIWLHDQNKERNYDNSYLYLYSYHQHQLNSNKRAVIDWRN